MHEKAKSKGPEISWAYRLSKMLHILKCDEIEVTATPEQCLQHLDKIYARDIYMHPFQLEVINNYKAYDVILRSVDESPRGGEAFFIFCHIVGKGDKTFVSFEVSLGKKIFVNFIMGLIVLPFFVAIFALFSHMLFNGSGELGYKLLFSPVWLITFLTLVAYVWFYPVMFQERNKMLKHVVGYMFRIEEKLASQHPLREDTDARKSKIERA